MNPFARLAARAALATAALSAGLWAPSPGRAATYTVNTGSSATFLGMTADATSCSQTHCTLSEAVAASNANAGVDRIEFAIPGSGPHVLDGGLIATDSVVIDAGSQAAVALAPECAQPLVEIRAEFAPFANPSYTQVGLSVGSGSTVRCLAIVGFMTNLELGNNNNVIVERNYIGLDANGTVPDVIGGVQRMAAYGWGRDGIRANGGGNNRIVDNVIAGLGGIAPGGVFTPHPAELITLEDSNDNVIRGNRFGTTPDGTAAVTPGSFGGVGAIGIRLISSNNNFIGGTDNTPEGPCTGDCNLISGVGIPLIASGSNLVIEGNFMGPDVTGSRVLAPLSNTVQGMQLNVTNAWIGGPDPHQRNVLSINARANVLPAIRIERGENVFIRGNYFGTDPTGTRYILPLNAAGAGIALERASNVLIGGTEGVRDDRCAGSCNLLSFIRDTSTTPPDIRNLRIEGNYIGTNLNGDSKLGPGGQVILTHDLVHREITVGGSNPTQGNVIAFGGGVTVRGEGTRPAAGSPFPGCAQPEPNCPGVTILSNRIFDNAGLGITLGSPYPVGNDDGDPDQGPNDVQNFPVIDRVSVESGATIVHGSVHSKPNRLYELQFFRNRACDQTHFYGEGEQLIRPDGPAAFVSTDGSGNVAFTYTFPFELGPTEVITGTATDPTFGLRWTSGFSQCRADVSVVKRASAESIKVGEPLTYTLTVQNAGPSPAYAAQVTDTLPAGVALEAAPTTSKGTCSVAVSMRIDCSLGDLGRNETVTIAIVVKPTQAGTITNRATVDWSAMRLFPAGAFDPDASNNSDTEQTSVVDSQTGTLVVKKATVPSGATTIFDFTAGGGLSPTNFRLSDGESRVFADVAARSGYSLAEAVPDGWQLNATCSDGSPTAEITVDPGETVECTFTNVKLATLTVKKETLPAGATAGFAFSAGGGLSPATFTLSGGGTRTFTNIVPRSGYSLSESVPAGWERTRASCDDGSSVSEVTLEPGETVMCTFTNELVLPPGGGAFVIGDRNAAIGSSVTFWGAQWWMLNSLTGGAAPAAFKGFALNPMMPSCGATWATDPGNSAPPPPGPLPAHMGVIVADSTRQSGLAISGNTLRIVVVATNAGYNPNTGHAGTGTVVSRVC